jgi:hypothetical protein
MYKIEHTYVFPKQLIWLTPKLMVLEYLLTFCKKNWILCTFTKVTWIKTNLTKFRIFISKTVDPIDYWHKIGAVLQKLSSIVNEKKNGSLLKQTFCKKKATKIIKSWRTLQVFKSVHFCKSHRQRNKIELTEAHTENRFSLGFEDRTIRIWWFRFDPNATFTSVSSRWK